MDVDPRLTRLEEARAEIKALEKKREESYAFWSLWKYYAQKQDWFTDFIHEEWVWWSELKFVSKPKSDTDVDVSVEHGRRLWRARRDILEAIDKLDREIYFLVLSLRADGFTLVKIGEFFGVTPGGIVNYLNDDARKHIDSIKKVG